MSAHLNVRAILRPGRKRALWQLLSPLVWEVTANGCCVYIRVPEGFVSDLASFPWFLRWYYPPDGPWAPAAVVHDWLYYMGVDRRLADVLFLLRMEQDGVWWVRILIFYAGLRLFGWLAYRRHRNRA